MRTFATHSRKFSNRFSRIRDAFAKVLDRVCTGFRRFRANSRRIRESSHRVKLEMSVYGLPKLGKSVIWLAHGRMLARPRPAGVWRSRAHGGRPAAYSVRARLWKKNCSIFYDLFCRFSFLSRTTVEKQIGLLSSSSIHWCTQIRCKKPYTLR
jgi:hypothetical protein